MSELPKPPSDFDISDEEARREEITKDYSQNTPLPENEFNHLELTPVVPPRLDVSPEPQQVNKELDHAALVAQGKRVAALEERVTALENRSEEDHGLIRKLRRLMHKWTED